MEELISVIVPIYHVELYLKECVDSILNQSYTHLEIILVDDGGDDDCPQICDTYAKIDSRIRVIHKQNGGLSDARNAGIKMATGKYLCFVDSDDVIDKEYVNILYKNLVENDADLSICHFKEFYDKKELNYNQINNIKVYSKEKILNRLYRSESLEIIIAWNKMYKRELWKNLEYPKGKIHEDEFTIHYILDKVSKVVITSGEYYYYRKRPGSIMDTYNIKRLHAIEAIEDRINFYDSKNDIKMRDKTIYQYFFMLKNNLNKIHLLENNEEIKKELEKKYIDAYKKVLKSNINILKKIKVLIKK